MPSKYSFVLPAYKAAFFREAIESILNQTYKDFELIIVNDASPEDLTSIVNSFHDNRIQYYINEKNVGGTDLVAQWNYCINYATGDYLILASDDDVFHSDYLAKMDVLVNKYPEVNVFRPRVQYIDSEGKVIRESKSLDEFLSYADFLIDRCNGKVSSGIPFYLFKREELINIGGFVDFPTAWFSDDATVIRLARNGVVSHIDTLFSFRMSGINISTERNNSQMLSKKLEATEAFYIWFGNELNGYYEKPERISCISLGLSTQMCRDILFLMNFSSNKAVFSSWNKLKKMKTLSTLECLQIFIKAIISKIREKIVFILHN